MLYQNYNDLIIELNKIDDEIIKKYYLEEVLNPELIDEEKLNIILADPLDQNNKKMLIEYINANNLEITGFSRELTLIDNVITNDESKFVTEISIPVREKTVGVWPNTQWALKNIALNFIKIHSN